MDRNQVASSNIRSIGYDMQTQTLEVEFLSGWVYQYYGVPEFIHQEIMQASSICKRHLKDNSSTSTSRMPIHIRELGNLIHTMQIRWCHNRFPVSSRVVEAWLAERTGIPCAGTRLLGEVYGRK